MSHLPPHSWTLRRWILNIAAVFAIQVSLIVVLSESRHQPQMRDATQTVFRLIPPASGMADARLSLATDPTLFLLPNSNSFSGSAWLNRVPRGHLISDWTEPPEWLALEAESLGGSFREYVRTRSPGPFAVADKPPPRLGALRLFVPAETFIHKSRLTTDATIQARLAEPLPALPDWAHSEPLSHSVVQIGIKETGEVMFAALLQRSGLPAADQHALQVARNLLFDPRPLTGPVAPGEGVVWGDLTFEWHTTAPPPPKTASTTP